MIRRNTQTAGYWRAPFQINDDDLEFLASTILEKEDAVSTEILTQALIAYRCQREENKIQNELSKGELYQPARHYEVGQQLVFASFDYALGTVVGSRPGQNPEHGDFEVIRVALEGQTEAREFAASLKSAHRLNRKDDDGAASGERMQSPHDLYVAYGSTVQDALAPRLEQSTQPSFVHEEDLWLLRDMLADVHVGHLNIAEALIDVKTQPVSTGNLLTEIDLPDEIPEKLRRFSVNHALRLDERFDDVGSAEEPAWYLRRLEPVEAYQVPELLKYQPVTYDRLALGVELLQLEWELDDEWSTDALAVDTPMLVPSTTIFLIYPHVHSGTLPLSSRTRSLFPRGQGARTMVTLIDGRWGSRFSAWVNHEARYIAGISGWYEQHKLPVGAIVTIERTREPLEYVLDFRPRRMRREWTRVAEVQEGTLNFQMQKQAISCDYDEHLVVGEASADALDELRQSEFARAPLNEIVRHVTRELAGLSSQGTVHAKTIYSAVNMVRRCPPGPIFSILATENSLRNVGGGYWGMAIR